MLCDRCQERNATVFLTRIVSGQMEKGQWCEACYAAIDPAHADAMAKGCRFCGGPLLCSLPFPSSDFVCARCKEEAYRFADVLISVDQKPTTELLAALDEHMKKWLSDNASPTDGLS